MRDRLPPVAVDGGQQFADPSGIGDSCAILTPPWRKSPFEISADVAGRPSCNHGVSEYAPADRANAMRGVPNAFSPQPLQHS